jgi:hypothetical protein
MKPYSGKDTEGQQNKRQMKPKQQMKRTKIWQVKVIQRLLEHK